MKRRAAALTTLQAHIGYTFLDVELLETALTHASHANESKTYVVTNERMEFLGDAVLSFLVAERLYRERVRSSEGELTRMRASAVNKRTLAEVARAFDLGSVLRLGKGARAAGTHRLDSAVANAFEALLGAAYLDGGLDACRLILTRSFNPAVVPDEVWNGTKDAKTMLQESVQARLRMHPSYTVIEWPEAGGSFLVEVRVHDRTLGQGSGLSKAEAEQAAALEALRGLEP
ncbi:MAG: ribonuclease III [Chloroflexia bacterium]|nr:ribonuclease III [Chloroflexia bacterium]